MATATASANRSPVRALIETVVSTRPAPTATDVGLAIVRALLAVLFIYHGARRLFGAFDGAGLDASAHYFAHTAGLSPGKLFAVLSGVTEFAGGIALAFGLFARLAGLGIFVDMMMAIITVTGSNGINSTGGNNGYELNLALGFLALVIVILGAGRFSVDALLERRLGGAKSASSN